MNFAHQVLTIMKLLVPVWSFLVISCLPSVKAQSPQDIAQLFGINGIVPDVLPVFAPSVLLQVTYAANVIPGEILSQNSAQAICQANIDSHSICT